MSYRTIAALASAAGAASATAIPVGDIAAESIAVEKAGGVNVASFATLLAGSATRSTSLQLDVQPGEWAAVHPAGRELEAGPMVNATGDFGGALGLDGASATPLEDETLGRTVATFGPRMNPDLDDPSDGPDGQAVPLPSAGLMGLAGLGAIGLRRRR